MSLNKNEQFQQCSLEPETETHPRSDFEFSRLDISKRIKEQLPANELRTARRPYSMQPRTLFLERPLFLLNQAITQPCLEVELRGKPGRLNLKIGNRNKLTIEQYFAKECFKKVYDKVQNVRPEGKSFAGKLKAIDSLIDYNWRLFKQLSIEIGIEEQKNNDAIDSDFQSGNLCKAFAKIEEPQDLYLIMENDINTHGYNNWFFFRFKNKETGPIRFHIVNFAKKTSFFSQGMLISIYSLRKSNYEGTKWFKGGDKITFGDVNFAKSNHSGQSYCYLSFQYDFQYQNDEVYFSLNQPYTYTRLTNFLEEVKQSSNQVEIETKGLGYTLSNNIIPYTKFSLSEAVNQPIKSVILILARQHPCQTVGSFVAEAIMKCLTCSCLTSRGLLEKYDFIVIPMLNPDGVIHGTSRCNMAGLDLNRQWGDNTIKQLCPQTIKARNYIHLLSKSRKIKYMIDLHGHGKKLNSFFFACKGDQKTHYQLLSLAMSKVEPRFNLYGCTYGITRDKESTIRSKMYGMGVTHSYTLQNSLYGWKDSDTIIHYNENDFAMIGRSLLQAIFSLQCDQQAAEKQLGFNRSTLMSQLSQVMERMEKEEKINMDTREVLSESDPDGDRLDVEQILGACHNQSIKLKIKENYRKIDSKREKRERKNVKPKSAVRLTMKSIRQSCPSQIQTSGKQSALAFICETSGHIDLLRKTEMKSTKKHSFSEKWKQKRKSIVQKKQIMDKHALPASNQVSSTNFKKSVTPSTRKMNPALYTYTASSINKSRLMNTKIKKQIEHSSQGYNFTQAQIAESSLKKSQIESKFQQLKQQSLSMLLNDTLSIVKINSNDKNGKRQKGRAATQPRECVQSGQYDKSKPIPTLRGQMKEKLHMKTEEREAEPLIESSKYRKFKQFVAQGTYSKKMTKFQNSVFYYFPIL